MNNNFLDSQRAKEHELMLKGRSEMSVSGVVDVMSFDEAFVELSTLCGGMNIEGEGIHISFLDVDNGRVTLTGTIFGVYYTQEKASKKSRGLFSGKDK